jgi:hypothetical protein
MTDINHNNKAEIAQELKEIFDAVNPFIQQHTSLVCPSCEKVCCINRHGNHDDNDKIFISALGREISAGNSEGNDTDPCRFLNPEGCSMDRWMRPFRCTWFFCDPLLESMEKDKGRAYREFVDTFKRLVDIRQKLIEELKISLDKSALL